MGVFFGTDGLRGKVNDDLSFDIVYKCGNALGAESIGRKILIGRDTRLSGELLTLAFASGAMNAGASVVDVGVCPTAGISYLTKQLGFDYGVVISASHNPAEFNGIKIFNSEGTKLGDKKEEQLEKKFLKNIVVNYSKLGTFSYEPNLVNLYKRFLINSSNQCLKGLKIVLDCSNGASSQIAPAVFKKLGASIVAIGRKPNGLNINKDCGSLNIENLQRNVLRFNADIGFAFDGDSDRIIAVDENGKVIDGDMIIYLLAKEYKAEGKLNPSMVVGTRHTNMGVEKALLKNGISLIRTDIGDKYVCAKLDEKDLLIGGEQSGHIVIKDRLQTGDGILNAIIISNICAKYNKKLSEFFDFEKYNQVNINVKVMDKMRVINSEELSEVTEAEERKLGKDGRIMIRISGTEPYIRVMVESLDVSLSKSIAEKLSNVVSKIDRDY